MSVMGLLSMRAARDSAVILCAKTFACLAKDLRVLHELFLKNHTVHVRPCLLPFCLHLPYPCYHFKQTMKRYNFQNVEHFPTA